jgi:FkbM family methyltransferase
VYIDCGANVGAVLEEKVVKYPAREYYAFEANPNLMDRLLAVKDRHPATAIQVFNMAVWTENSKIDLYLSAENSRGEPMVDGSTLLRGKMPSHPLVGRIDYDHPVEVQALNFSQWILENFRKEDYVWLKMDIEGSEYAVLEQMLKDGSIHSINKAYVEFHYRDGGHLQSISKETHDSVYERVSKRTKLVTWH